MWQSAAVSTPKVIERKRVWLFCSFPFCSSPCEGRTSPCQARQLRSSSSFSESSLLIEGFSNYIFLIRVSSLKLNHSQTKYTHGVMPFIMQPMSQANGKRQLWRKEACKKIAKLGRIWKTYTLRLWVKWISISGILAQLVAALLWYSLLWLCGFDGDGSSLPASRSDFGIGLIRHVWLETGTLSFCKKGQGL